VSNALDRAVDQYNSAKETPTLDDNVAQVRATLAVAAALIAIAEKLGKRK
jgi:hypothetical protein